MSPPNIPVAALEGIKAARPGNSPAGRADARGLLPQLVPGQLLSARVDAVLPDSNFRVTVANQPLRMALPKYFAPGDRLELVFVAREPRLTFALTETPRAAVAPAVSAAGRVIASVLPPPAEAAMLASVANAAPLLAAAPQDSAVLSTILQGTLNQSGFFYESHQAEWVTGKRELAALLREPQARLMSTAQQPAAQTRQPAASPAVQHLAAGIAPATDVTLPAAAVPGESALPQQVQALVQQQLAALETGRFAFQLQVWPGQWMRWEIDEDTHNACAEMSHAPQRLQTRLHLDLPRLGAVDATLTFDAASVRVRLATAETSSADLLQDNRTSLRAALADAGMRSVDIAVARHEPV